MNSFVFNPFTGNFDEISEITLAPVGSSPNANAATLTGQVLNLEPASSSFPGVVTTTTQSFLGSKTFLSPVSITNSAVDAALFGMTITVANNTTVDGSNNLEGEQTSVTATVQSGATNDKAVSGWVNTVQRGDGTDDGTLQQLDGSTSILFQNSGAAGVTNQAIGYDLAVITQQGTITDLYDFRSQRIPAGGTVTNHYGLYLTGDATTPIKSWMSGSTLFGKTSFSAPVSTVEIAGAMSLDGATSGVFTQQANAVTTDYTVSWPAAQGAASTALFNDGAGNLSWVAPGTSAAYSAFNIIQNMGIQASVDGSNNLIIVLKQSDGTSDPTGGSPTILGFRNFVSVVNVGYTLISTTSTTSLTVPAGATLGTANGEMTRLYLYAQNNAGVVELGISYALFDESQLGNTTTISAGSSSSGTLYATTGLTGTSIRLLGYIDITEATAGQWATNPAITTLVTEGALLSPGSARSASTGAFSTSSSSFVQATSVTVSVKGPGAVKVYVQGDGTTDNSYIGGIADGSFGQFDSNFKVVRDSTTVSGIQLLGAQNNGFFNSWGPGGLSCVDFPGPGSHSYSLQAQQNRGALGATADINFCVLVIVED